MRKLALATLLLAGCASGGADPRPAVPVADTSLADLQTSMTELLERMDVLNDRITRLEADRAAVPASALPVQVRAAESGAAAQNPQERASAGQTQRAVVGATIAENYRNAIVLFGRNRIADARAAFQQVYAADPAGELADNALFWIGETYFAANDFANAMSFYRRVSEEYGDQNKAPDSLYKLALAYEKTGDLALARKALEEVISRYPYSSPAAAAKAELKRIKY
ncbi:MAG: tetratricopeptide repeat protein [Thermoanaerobaculia bacterium]|nr:tetratricopeptide repeat protein [Thermoanaerobaculia bacterium]